MISKKWLMTILALILIAVVITGCSGNNNNNINTNSSESTVSVINLNKTGFPIVNDPITLSMMGSKTANQLEWSDMAFFQEMTKRTNIKFEFDTPSNDSYREKLNLKFASGSLPSVLFGANLLSENEILFGNQGQLIPLENLIKQYAPNILKLLDENPEIRRSITTPDGHIYSLPFVDTPSGFGRFPKLWINETWLNELKLKMPTKLEDLIAVFKAFKNNDPNKNGKADEIPLSYHMTAGGEMDIQSLLMSAFGFTGYITVDGDKVRFAPSESEYKAYLEFMNQLYKEGLLDKEGYSQTVQQKNSKGNNNQLGVFQSGGAFQVVGNNLDKNYSILPPLTSQWNAKPFAIRNSNITRGTFAITSSNKYPEATIRWVDYLYSDEGAILVSLGIEGKHYEYIDNKQGIKELLPEGGNSIQFRGTISPNAGTLVPRINKPIQNLNWYKLEVTNPLNFHIKEQTQTKLEPVARDSFPLIYFTLEEQQQLKVMDVDISTYVNEMSAKFIVGETSLDKWDEYIGTLNSMKIKKYLEIYQQAYDRWKKGGH